MKTFLLVLVAFVVVGAAFVGVFEIGFSRVEEVRGEVLWSCPDQVDDTGQFMAVLQVRGFAVVYHDNRDAIRALTTYTIVDAVCRESWLTKRITILSVKVR